MFIDFDKIGKIDSFSVGLFFSRELLVVLDFPAFERLGRLVNRVMGAEDEQEDHGKDGKNG